MKSIGIRAHPEQYVYVILEGTQTAPTIVDKGICMCPQGASTSDKLVWARNDVREVLTKHAVDCAQVKTVEGNARNKDPKRLQLEGVLVEGIASHACQPETRLVVKTQVKAATGFKKLAKYLAGLLANQTLTAVSSPAYEDAALAALAGLPKE